MKQLMRVFPFLLVFVAVFFLQVIWTTDNQIKPYLTPFGRETQIGNAGVNRPVQVLEHNKYAWLTDHGIAIGTIEPAQSIAVENRPAPEADIFDYSSYQLVGNDIFWIGGKDQMLKHATWQIRSWSAPQNIAAHADSLLAVQVKNRILLVAGLGKTMKVWTVDGNTLHELHSYPVHQVRNLSGTFDAQGNLHVGAADERAAQLIDLQTFTVNTNTWQASPMSMAIERSLPSSTTIQDLSFGLDKTHGYFLVTYMSSRSFTSSLGVVTFPLNNPTAGEQVGSPFADQELYGAYAAAGQGDSLAFLTVGDYAKNPRVQGKEAFICKLQNGVWTTEQTRVSNSHGVAINPVYDKQDGETTVLFMLQTTYGQYQIYFNSDVKAYATETNKETAADYTAAAMQVPQYMGIAVVISFMVTAWPLLSYVYLLFFVFRKNEDTLYDHAERHLLIAAAIYFLSQLVVFLNYAKLENFMIYSPAWMHSNGAIALLLFLLAVLSYALTKLFYSRLRYERQALHEFGYFFLLNAWTVLLGFSYFMAS